MQSCFTLVSTRESQSMPNGCNAMLKAYSSESYQSLTAEGEHFWVFGWLVSLHLLGYLSPLSSAARMYVVKMFFSTRLHCLFASVEYEPTSGSGGLPSLHNSLPV